MKITYAIPKGKTGIAKFLKKELSQAHNIKDKKVREQVIQGLEKLFVLAVDGFVYYWDGETQHLLETGYRGTETVYFCGKEFKKIEEGKKTKYLLVILDANECTIGMLEGKRIITLWNETSYVPRKQDAGGQSAVRYQRNRELALKHWYKKIADKLKEIMIRQNG